jgi:hypothetical protein
MVRGGFRKYTCPLCHFRYTAKDVKSWWRKPDNKYKKAPVPSCPVCGCCGYILGWHDDLNDYEPDKPFPEKLRNMLRQKPEYRKPGGRR